MRKNIVAGNWKMNTNLEEANLLTSELIEKLHNQNLKCEVIIAPPFPFLNPIYNQIKDSKISLAAQNCNENEKGAFTGEVSTTMLKSLGVEYIIIGHSERREQFKESSAALNLKVKATLNNELIPIFCCGESLEIRESGKHEAYVCKQIEEGLFDLSEKEFSKIVIAYEPIWAIGTGVTASSAQAQDMHKAIRTFIKNKFGEAISENTSILYGGSCKPTNAKELFEKPDVDGGLIGGAALKADDFIGIITSF